MLGAGLLFWGEDNRTYFQFGIVNNGKFWIARKQDGKWLGTIAANVDSTAINQGPGATNTLLDPGFPDFIVNPFKKVLQYGACHKIVSCLVERARAWLFELAPPYLVEDVFHDLVPTDSVIGSSHRMVSSALTRLPSARPSTSGLARSPTT